MQKIRGNQKWVVSGFFIIGFAVLLAAIIINLNNASVGYNSEITGRMVNVFLSMLIAGYIVECDRLKYLLSKK